MLALAWSSEVGFGGLWLAFWQPFDSLRPKVIVAVTGSSSMGWSRGLGSWIDSWHSVEAIDEGHSIGSLRKDSKVSGSDWAVLMMRVHTMKLGSSQLWVCEYHRIARVGKHHWTAFHHDGDDYKGTESSHSSGTKDHHGSCTYYCC